MKEKKTETRVGLGFAEALTILFVAFIAVVVVVLGSIGRRL